ncbi:hypothetical protein [Rhizobacter sp. Root404]|uniref:hypothetical protein n=1 Tax=Rhizobacter sp. Root404 TaxID=1736528 RepID=UPI000A46E1B9|nr:hypothetical protein [Rhizobacter sp. Root404]
MSTPPGNGSLKTCDIGQLEALFASSPDDRDVLGDLQEELRYRRTPRALALLTRIQSTFPREPKVQVTTRRPASMTRGDLR